MLMKQTRILVLLMFMANCALAREPRQPKTVSTFSIVACDPATGQMGVAVASRYFAVGSVVPWGMAGVGAVADDLRQRRRLRGGSAGGLGFRIGASPGVGICSS